MQVLFKRDLNNGIVFILIAYLSVEQRTVRNGQNQEPIIPRYKRYFNKS